MGLAANGPPDGFTFVLPGILMASATIRCWWVKGPWISATSMSPVCPPVAILAASLVDGDSVMSRAPSAGDSMRCSIPVIHAGFSRSSRARLSAASTTAAAPSVIGAMSWRRSGSAKNGRASSSPTVIGGSTESTRRALVKESNATRAICSWVHLPESSPNRACSPAIDTESGHSGATVYGSVWRDSTRRSVPAEDFPKPYTSAVSTSPVSSLM
ncbi:Uncharacterised protein [Mycobacterium tuberculosis]|nr:Uncharacterised protein [Mycobacterium tuberculosis]